MVEANFQSLFSTWMTSEQRFTQSAVFELKLEKTQSIRFDRVAPHQVDGLRRSKRMWTYHKIADSPFIKSAGKMMRFTKPKPFDCFVVMDALAYVVVLFYEPRQSKEMFFIDVDTWVDEQKRSIRKSLTKQRAREIAQRIEEL